MGRIVFDRYRNGPEGMYLGTFLLDASRETQIDFPVDADEGSAVLSPDGKRLLVDSFSRDGSSVGTLDLATGTYAPLDHGLIGDVLCTDWTPDGGGVLCSLSSESGADDGIYAIRLTDGAVTRLTHSEFHFVEGTNGSCGGGEGRAVYSPDGRRFAYEQQKCGSGPDPGGDEQGAIVVANADGSNPVTVVPFGGVRTHAGGEISWSPVDDRIAFATQEGVLSVVNSDGTGLHKIELPVPGFVAGPAWSPDGNWILVGIDAGRGADLYAVSPDGAQAIQLTSTLDTEVFTDWGAPEP